MNLFLIVTCRLLKRLRWEKWELAGKNYGGVHFSMLVESLQHLGHLLLAGIETLRLSAIVIKKAWGDCYFIKLTAMLNDIGGARSLFVVVAILKVFLSHGALSQPVESLRGRDKVEGAVLMEEK